MIENNFFLFAWLNRILRLDRTEQHVSDIKKHTADTIDDAARSVQRAGDLQAKVIKQTTTYYIGKAVGAVK